MKLTDVISQIRTDNKIEVKKTRQMENGSKATVSSSPDTVDLSSGSKDVQKMQEILNQTPSVRTELIESLKAQIEGGTYNVDSRDIADKMMDEFLSENQIQQQ